MISIFGEVWFSSENGNDSIDGFGYRIARELSVRGAFPLFITGLGKDERGRFSVEKMVEDEVMFDPELSLLPYPTAGLGEDISQTALANVPEKELLEACGMQSNLFLGYFTTPVFMCSPSRESYLSQMARTPFPILQLVDGLRLDDETFRKAEKLARFVMTEHEDERITKDYILIKDGEAELRKNGKTVMRKKYDDKISFISDLLQYLDTEDESQDEKARIEEFMGK